MKRKFFSVMLAACAAVFSFSGLTGCSGGGDEEHYGVVTLSDFKAGNKHIGVGFGATYVEIIPDTSGTGTEPPGGNVDIDPDTREGTYETRCTIGGAGAMVTYHIESWPEGDEFPSKGEVYLTDAEGKDSGTWLEILFDATDGVVDTAVLQAFGLDTQTERLGSNVKVGLRYAEGRATGVYLVQYTDDSKPADKVKNPDGKLYVIKG